MKIVICIPNSTKHYVSSGISLIAIYDTYLESVEYFPIDLVDIDNVDLPKIPNYHTLLVYNKKLFDKYYFGYESYDIETEFWMEGADLDKSQISFKSFQNFYRRQDFYRYIPYYQMTSGVYNFISYLKDNLSKVNISSSSIFYKDIVYPTIENIESNGLCVDLESFNNNFNKNYVSNIVRSYFNLHTSTGRPSNTFDNVNYSALSKKDGSRESFVSRFDDGYLVEYDFDSYHLRLIGKLIGYDFENIDSIHTEFAKYFFNKEDITEEDYQNSKKLSFTLLYKDSKELLDTYNIEFFSKVNIFKEKLFEKYKEDGYLRSPVSKRKLKVYENFDMSKLFNYFIQMIETEFSMLFIYDIINLLKDNYSKIILYTYDSILLDFNPKDGLEILKSIENKLLKTKIFVGKNYKEMRRVSLV